MTQTQIFSEALDLTEATINAERRQIQGVVLIKAGMSKNRRHYSESVLQRDAHVFEGSKSFDNHAGGSRSIRDITGWYTNVRYTEGKLMADRHFTETAAGNDAWAIAKAVMDGSAPRNLAGLSINAVGVGKKHATEEGAMEIESITSAISVDDVSEPAAGGRFKESANGDLTAAFWEAVTFEEYQQARPEYIERLKKEWKTTRQDDAVKAARAESEESLKAVRAELDSANAALKEAQTQIETLQAERDTAFIEVEKASRVNALEQALSKAIVPADWKKPLRESLLKADASAWAGMIETEETKAKSAGHRISVTGASQQVNAPLKEAPKPKNAPYDMNKIDSPAALIAYLAEG
jgi:hypothetical protein